MGNFNRGGNKFGGGNRGGGGRGFGGGSRGGFGGGRRERPEMHKATCSDCGNSCEVPFRPTGDKPVLCSNCFENSGGGNNRDRGGRGGRGRDFGGRGGRGRDFGGDRQMHRATCADCGDSCEVPFRPTGDKPVLCSNCFAGNSGGSNRSGNDSSEKHDEIIAKLDKIITLLQRTNPVKEVTVMKADAIEETLKEVVEETAEILGKKPKKKVVAKKAPAKKKAVAKKAPVKKAPAKKTTKKK